MLFRLSLLRKYENDINNHEFRDQVLHYQYGRNENLLLHINTNLHQLM